MYSYEKAKRRTHTFKSVHLPADNTEAARSDALNRALTSYEDQIASLKVTTVALTIFTSFITVYAVLVSLPMGAL